MHKVLVHDTNASNPKVMEMIFDNMEENGWRLLQIVPMEGTSFWSFWSNKADKTNTKSFGAME